MEFYSNYYETGKTIRSKAAQDEFYGAIIRYLFEGTVPLKFRSREAEIAFQAIAPSRKKQWAGRKNKLGQTDEVNEKKPPSNGEANGKEDESKPEGTDKEAASNAEGNEKKLIREEANKLTSIVNPPIIPPTEFPIACLAIFNDLFGTTYSTLPPTCARTLDRLKGTYSLSDVERMIRYKRDEWQGTRFSKALTPNTLFSPEHFEQYIHQSKSAEERSRSYAEYD